MTSFLHRRAYRAGMAEAIRAIAAVGDEAVRLGVVFDEHAIAQSTLFNDTLRRLGQAMAGVKNTIGQVFIPELTRLAQTATDFIVSNRQQIVDWVQRGWNYLVQVVKDVIALFQGREGDVVNQWIIEARDGLLDFLDVLNTIFGVVKGIIDLFRTVKDFATSLPDSVARLGQGARRALGSDAPGFAGGGLVRGPGSATSDSILARLSRGEFVIREAVVNRLGAPFFHALNRGLLPAFADGGPVGGGRPLNLTIAGQTFSGTMAADVIESLSRHVRATSRRSPGRAPGWVG